MFYYIHVHIVGPLYLVCGNMLLTYLEITLSPIHIRQYTRFYDHSKQQRNKTYISKCTNSGSECVK
jgi:hypothetical protein